MAQNEQKSSSPRDLSRTTLGRSGLVLKRVDSPKEGREERGEIQLVKAVKYADSSHIYSCCDVLPTALINTSRHFNCQ